MKGITWNFTKIFIVAIKVPCRNSTCPSKKQQDSRNFSRQHPEIDKIQQEEGGHNPMTEAQATEILQRLKIPFGNRFTKEEVATLLDVPSLPKPVPKKTHKSTEKEGVRVIKNVRKMLPKRTVKEPRTTNKRPGIVRLTLFM